MEVSLEEEATALRALLYTKAAMVRAGTISLAEFARELGYVEGLRAAKHLPISEDVLLPYDMMVLYPNWSKEEE